LRVIKIFTILKIWVHYLYDERCETYVNHKSLKYLFIQKERNMKQRRWLELIEDYDYDIIIILGRPK
jgi:hypothetical protein